jgi:type I restriction enzyme S subunit
MSEQSESVKAVDLNTLSHRSPRFLAKTKKLPDEWEIKDGKSIANIKTGHTPSRDVDRYWDGKIPWIAIHDLTNIERVEIHSTEESITKEGLNNSGAKLIPEGTFVLCRTGSIGASAILGKEMATDQSTVSFETFPDLADPYFLMYIFQYCQPELNRLGIGSTHPSIQLDFFPNLKIPTPPLKEQRRIANILYTIDQLIRNTDEIVDSYRRIRQGIKQDVFTSGYFDHNQYKKSQIGTIPDSWDIKPASEICENITVGVVTGATNHYVDVSEGVPFIRSKDVHETHIDQTNLKYISKDFHEQQSSSELNEGDVITVRTGDPGTSCVVPPELEGSNCFSLIISKPKEVTNESFYNYYLNSPKAVDFIDSWKAGGVQDNFNIGVMKRLPVPLPDDEEQMEIVDLFDSINKKIDSERRRRLRLERLKQGLMQDLFSGEVRTHEIDIEDISQVL